MASNKLHTVSFFEFIFNSKDIVKNPLPFHHQRFETYGDVFKVKLGFSKPIFFTRDPLFVKYMLQQNHKNFIKSELQTKYLGKYIGHGLLTANGADWLKQRRLIQPAFHKNKLALLVENMHNQILLDIGKIKKNQPIDVFPLMCDLAFNVVARSLFSFEDNGDTITKLQVITEEVQLMVIKEVRQPFKKWWYYLSGKIKRTLQRSNEARAILLSLIEERRASEESFDDLLDMLLSASYDDGSVMSNEQLIDEILILFIAGYETTSNALSFTFHLLAKHPSIQEKLFDEVKEGAEENLLDKLQNLQYTKQCIEESMRLYPPAYFSDRVALEDDEYNGVSLPKGTQILMSFYEVHRHKKYWKFPEAYDPDRFHPSRKKEYAACYFPFGAGPRMCIGNNFAMYEMILAVSEVVKKYKITTKNEIQVKPLITLKPKNAILTFEERIDK